MAIFWSTFKLYVAGNDRWKEQKCKEADGWLFVTGIRGLMGKGGDGVLFGRAGTAVPLQHHGGQGQVMHTREIVGPKGMACALRNPGVQGNMAVTLNQNRRLPFESLEGRRFGGQINTKVGCGVSHLSPVYEDVSLWLGYL